MIVSNKCDDSQKKGQRRSKNSHIVARRVARLNAVQALYQMETSGQGMDFVIDCFVTEQFGSKVHDIELAQGDSKFFKALVISAVEHQELIDRQTSQLLVSDWPIERIDPTLRAIFRAAGAELIVKNANIRIAISEFVEVTKAFFPEGKQAGLVNGVLDKMARQLQPEAFVPRQ